MHKMSPPEDVSSSAFPLGSNSEGWQSSSLQRPHSGPHDPPEAKNPAERPLESLLSSLLPPKLAPGNGSTPPSERNQGAGSLSRALRLQDHTRTGRGHLRPLNRGRLSAHGLPEQEQDRASAGSHSAIISFLSSFFSPR